MRTRKVFALLQHATSLQAKLSIIRYCANTQLVYFLRAMPPSVTRDAARLHDDIIEKAVARALELSTATPTERRHARLDQPLPRGPPRGRP